MIDFHNHVIPFVDDGPNSFDESLEMCRCAEDQGITDIVQTVHFQHPKMENKNVEYNYLRQKVKEMQSILIENKIKIKLHLAAEVFYLPNLLEISDNKLVTVNNGKYMLIEFSNNIFPNGYENVLFKLQSQGVIPIIAHPERYRFVQNDLDLLNLWIERGYIIQIDAGSLIGQFGKKTQKISLEMIDKGYVHIIGSDAHNSRKRNFCLLDGYNKINEVKSVDYSDKLKSNVYSILNGGELINLNDKSNMSNKKNNHSYFIDKIFKFIYNK
tara:strand:+ start:2017 stop:2826 length:810 start_codon:yes stop_codon:yes gene_type:complete